MESKDKATTAEILVETYEGEELLECCNSLSTSEEQDYEEETSTFTFEDGSKVKITTLLEAEVVK